MYNSKEIGKILELDKSLDHFINKFNDEGKKCPKSWPSFFLYIFLCCINNREGVGKGCLNNSYISQNLV